MKWINFLHLYQPPHQDPHLVKRISKESYLYIIKILKKNPNAKITVNISGALTEQLIKLKQKEVIEGIARLAKRGQIELVGTAKYHPILPLLPDHEIIRQIEINNSLNKSCFGSVYQPKGFFLPEMAYSKRVADIIKQKGFEWIILDEFSYKGSIGDYPSQKKYIIKDNGLVVVFRNRHVSKSYVPETVLECADNNFYGYEYLVTATDGEMYGHHHKDYANIFDKSLKDPRITTLTVSQLLRLYSEEEVVEPVYSSWETNEEDIRTKNPYSLWSDPKNKIQGLLWELADLVIKTVKKENGGNEWSQKHLDQGLASCSWWWASQKRPDAFTPLTWNPSEIERGAKDLIASLRSLDNVPASVKIKGEEIFLRITKEIWKQHWGKTQHKIKNTMRHTFSQKIIEKRKNEIYEKYSLTPQHVLSTTGHYFVTNCHDQKRREFILKIRLKNNTSAKNTFLREISFWLALNDLKGYPLARPKLVYADTKKTPEYLLYQIIPGQSVGILYYFYNQKTILERASKITSGLIFIQKNSQKLIKKLPSLQKYSYKENFSFFRQFLKTAKKHVPTSILRQATDMVKKNRIFLNKQPLKINHGDLNPRNFILSPSTNAIIDWSNVSLNNLMMDAAFFSLVSWQNGKIQEIILSEYLKNFTNKKENKKLFLLNQIILAPKFIQILDDSIKYADTKQKKLIKIALESTKKTIENNIKELSKYDPK